MEWVPIKTCPKIKDPCQNSGFGNYNLCCVSNKFGVAKGKVNPEKNDFLLLPECRQGSLILGQVFIGTNSNILVLIGTLIFEKVLISQ